MRKTGKNSRRERRIRGHASCLVKKQTEEAQRKREEVKKTWGWSGEAAKREKYRGRERRSKINVESKNVACTCHERRYHAFSVKLLIIE